MGSDNPPAMVQAHPCLTLTAPDAFDNEFGVDGSEIVAECRDDCVVQAARRRFVDDASPIFGDFTEAVQVLRDSIADGVIRLPEQLVQDIDIVFDQRSLITIENGRKPGMDLGEVDFDIAQSGSPAMDCPARR
jgi:hypothetical protein